MKIILLYGGQSPEHDVSILSAFSILHAIFYNYYEVEPIYIQKDGTWKRGPILHAAPVTSESLRYPEVLASMPCSIQEPDAIIFPVLHGPNGEDGTIQGFIETLGMPYVGCGVLASACAMDKIVTKNLLLQASIPQLPFVPVVQSFWKENPRLIFEQCEGTLIYPMFVKPANMGSSVGISKVDNREQLQQALGVAFEFDERVVVEQGIEAREIEVGLLGNTDVRTTLPGEIVKSVEFYDYNAKYIDNDIEMVVPAVIDEKIQEKIMTYAKRAYQIISGTGLARCDFFLTSHGEIFLNELNTMPGFTEFSMYPTLWHERGLQYGDLIEELIQLGLKRFEKRQHRLNLLNQAKE